MKKLAVIMTICALSTMTFAQQKLKSERVSPEKKQELKMQKMEAELDLTPEQKQKIEAIDAKYAPIEKEQKEKWEALKKESKAIKTQKREEIKLVLTPDQLKIMEEKKEEKKEHAKSHRKEMINERKEAPKK
jgi:Spy/CpxP family protein refolding chaperone